MLIVSCAGMHAQLEGCACVDPNPTADLLRVGALSGFSHQFSTMCSMRVLTLLPVPAMLNCGAPSLSSAAWAGAQRNWRRFLQFQTAALKLGKVAIVPAGGMGRQAPELVLSASRSIHAGPSLVHLSCMLCPAWLPCIPTGISLAGLLPRGPP